MGLASELPDHKVIALFSIITLLPKNVPDTSASINRAPFAFYHLIHRVEHEPRSRVAASLGVVGRLHPACRGDSCLDGEEALRHEVFDEWLILGWKYRLAQERRCRCLQDSSIALPLLLPTPSPLHLHKAIAAPVE